MATYNNYTCDFTVNTDSQSAGGDRCSQQGVSTSNTAMLFIKTPMLCKLADVVV